MCVLHKVWDGLCFVCACTCSVTSIHVQDHSQVSTEGVVSVEGVGEEICLQ